MFLKLARPVIQVVFHVPPFNDLLICLFIYLFIYDLNFLFTTSEFNSVTFIITVEMQAHSQAHLGNIHNCLQPSKYLSSIMNTE